MSLVLLIPYFLRTSSGSVTSLEYEPLELSLIVAMAAQHDSTKRIATRVPGIDKKEVVVEAVYPVPVSLYDTPPILNENYKSKHLKTENTLLGQRFFPAGSSSRLD